MPAPMPEMATAAEEAREQVEGVIAAAASRAAGAVLLDAVVAVLVVDFAE